MLIFFAGLRLKAGFFFERISFFLLSSNLHFVMIFMSLQIASV